MQFTINKIAYNVFKPFSEKEKISVDIKTTFGSSKADKSKRAIFVELSIDGEDEQTQNKTCNLITVARLNYQLDKNLFPNLNDKPMDEDDKYFLQLLERLNQVVKNITSQDDLNRTLNIDKAITHHRKQTQQLS